jgi:hypothetical protein
MRGLSSTSSAASSLRPLNQPFALFEREHPSYVLLLDALDRLSIERVDLFQIPLKAGNGRSAYICVLASWT